MAIQSPRPCVRYGPRGTRPFRQRSCEVPSGGLGSVSLGRADAESAAVRVVVGRKIEMRLSLRSVSRRGVVALGGACVVSLALATTAGAATSVVSSDPFTQVTCKASALTNHKTEVEPDTFANGATIVSAFQVGRVYDGGACAIGFATSK